MLGFYSQRQGGARMNLVVADSIYSAGDEARGFQASAHGLGSWLNHVESGLGESLRTAVRSGSNGDKEQSKCPLFRANLQIHE